jgi:hypothetical protein
MKFTPIILDSLMDSGTHLDRIESQAKDDKTEKWLQRLIFEHPDLLPVHEFDESFAPLIPLGCEVATRSGSLDNLYISPVGRLIIVETKLWKNPEQHRTVVAQLIDYAKDVSEWNYDELSNAILKASRETGSKEKRSLDQIVEPHMKNAGLTLTDFQERVIYNLQTGEFLLLIVGDRISPNVALLTEAVHGVPGLDFRLGLVELQLYPLEAGSDWPLLIIPDIVGRTVEKTRGIIKIQYKQEKPKVAVEISEDLEPKGRTTPEQFLQKAPDDLRPVYEQWIKRWESKKFYISWGTVGFSLRITVQGKPQTVLDAYPEWAVSLIREVDAEKCGASRELYQKYLGIIDSVPKAISLLSFGKKYITNDSITGEDLMEILKAATEFAEAVKD